MPQAQTYQSEFTGLEMDERFTAVPALQQAVAGLLADIANYYTKAQVDAIAASIAAAVNSTAGVTAASLPTASADTLGKIYYIGPTSGEYARYVTGYDGTTYSWLPLGTTDIDLSDYATKAELNQLDQEITVSDTLVLTPGVLDGYRVSGGTTLKITSVSGESVYYVPVIEGKRYVLSYKIASGYVRYGFTAVEPASGVAVSNPGSTGTLEGTIIVTAPSNGYFAASVTVAGLSRMDFTTGKDDIGADVYNLKIGREKFCALPLIEMGGINGVTAGWSYRHRTDEVRTICGLTLHLKPGDIVESDVNTIELLLLYKDATGAGASVSGGWVSKYTVVTERDYVFKARYTNQADVALYNPANISSHIFITAEGKQSLLDRAFALIDPFRNYHHTVLSFAHRGYNLAAPENTLPAFKLAKEHGFYGVEMDIQLTDDDEIVVIHDTTVDRTSDGTGNVADMTLAQLKALDFGSWFNESFADVTIPTFAEALALCRKLGMSASVELKYTMTAERAAQVVETIRANGMAGKVKLSATESSWLATIAAVDNTIPLSLVTNTYTADKLAEMVAIRSQYGSPVGMSTSDANTQSVVNDCAAAGVDISWWVVNEPSEIAAGLPGITSITSDAICAGRVLWGYNLVGQ